MNRLALVAATGFLALTLTACGENGSSKPTVTTDTTTTSSTPVEQAAPEQQAAPAPAETPAAPAAPESTENQGQ